LLSCRITVADVASGRACCRLEPCHRSGGARRARRYPSDTTDAQWAVLDRLLPEPAWLAGQGGRPEVHCRRQIVDAIFYLVDNGNKWRALPADFPPWSTVYNYRSGWASAWAVAINAVISAGENRYGIIRDARPGSSPFDGSRCPPRRS